MRSYLVTGCSRGIGLELTCQLANSNDDIVIFASARSFNNPKFQELLRRHPERVVYVPLDVADQGSIKNAVDIITSNLDGKGLDVLINNAGVMSNGPAEEMDDLEEVFRTNVIGVHNFTRAVLPLMRKGKEKKVLNISTTLGSISKQFINHAVTVPSYKITKSALNMLTVLYANKTPMNWRIKHSQYSVLAQVIGWDGNGRFFNVHVPGWENVLGLNQYDGKEVPW
ncbi:putative short chain dehydrogenase/reductase family oxidoreductase [Aspergillus fischeri NRRL 181]|uniref:Short chain dehydrogenase/reductase family oxidoreductase, putative n=1 Tax=Neosartorya fischeri (strain ATCC 1020 / DSM 3700 / CBS 544.65 / FGSC A1164 / JCM 1740 / NRRL 181 / WB 181) TaxID=331117 RepID=A1DNP7_NEOFI|nr:short chain dehydrogenase/reductase family oxidoreductase, putative [Aspergillus fischeri NRRL 181]EAW16418.1 short chain dehydrogenase/reductase family oxidoreductase, putative [Aspergillus fischeri NRRL 181]